jgi:glycosyltransferase involved in cell wall biosynthesis
MRIGIYNRYWNTFGGGEKYTGTIAEILSHDHDVELISVEYVDWELFQSRLHLDLSKCSTLQWPNEPCSKLSFFTASYDLFINSTYGSSIMPRSPQSALICYFPHRIDYFTIIRFRATQWIKILLSDRRKKLFSQNKQKDFTIVPISGFFPIESDGRIWIGSEAIFKIMSDMPLRIQIPLWPDSYNGIQCIKVDNNEVTWWQDGGNLCFTSPEKHAESNIISISSKPMPLMDMGSDTRVLGACLDTCNIRWGELSATLSHSLPEKTPIEALSAYDRIISISHFTTEWINKRWQLSSVELQPPIDNEEFNCDLSFSKEKIILSVGRFFAGGHNKKHFEMAEAFIKMRSDGSIPNDWHLVLVGARHLEHPMHIAYYEKLEALCAGHPIDLRPDLPFSELINYYRRASIYWHAAGWGERIERFPERFEHFGMTTCEAMACGCVPIVFDAAGQKEIVSTVELGYRFSSYEMLAQQMNILTNATPVELKEMGKKAQESIARFARSTFGERVREAFNDIAY